MPCNKDCCNGKEVVCKFLCTCCLLFLTENHEFCPSLFEDKFQELESISTESVFVPDHNFADSAAVDLFQKGLQAWSLEVEP